jgi:hypothetical protein
MSLLLKKATSNNQAKSLGKYEKFNLKENPFPSAPVVNKGSTDARINGKIFEMEIRKNEFGLLESNFLKTPQNDPNHLRIGFIVDSSYVGRGNGKSAFLVNVLDKINKEFCLDISEGANKCFCSYVSPEPGGRTKSFDQFIFLFYDTLLEMNIISTSLATLRLEALMEVYPNFDYSMFSDDDEAIAKLNDKDWYKANGYDLGQVSKMLLNNPKLQGIDPNFPLFRDKSSIFIHFVLQEDFRSYFLQLRRKEEALSYIFNDLVIFFSAAGFNGAYVFVDDFERIPDFQSARQKKDFALELRTCLYDGLYENAKIGFYNFVFVLHAGVQRLISEAWGESGLENRAPISSSISSKHIIPFEKLTHTHAKLLLMRYLSEFRIEKENIKSILPFTEDVVVRISELSEYNASKILQKSYMLLEKASLEGEVTIIDESFLASCFDGELEEEKQAESIADTGTIDLMKKVQE